MTAGLTQVGWSRRRIRRLIHMSLVLHGADTGGLVGSARGLATSHLRRDPYGTSEERVTEPEIVRLGYRAG